MSSAHYKNISEFDLYIEGEKGVYFVKLNYNEQTTVLKVVKE
ncbi:MAG: T9SS type A sorting domain-containing protein [Bacteroidetes bacterium]|nr:T9SS type A sorting domain-containing protein [Bacteroidota bacterium]